MHEDIRNLIQTSRHCVLATASSNQPYCSLMAYVPMDKGTRICMATHQNTRKYGNLIQNPNVSLLIDQRHADPPQALTLVGPCKPIGNPTEAQKIRAGLLLDHPDMEGFLNDPDCVIICVQVRSAVYLNNLTDVYREEIS